MTETLLIIVCLLLVVAIILIIAFRSKNSTEIPQLKNQVSEILSELRKLESNLKDDFRINRQENGQIAKDNREELNNTLKNITEQSQNALRDINKTLEENNKKNRDDLTKNLKDFGLTLASSFEGFQLSFDKNVGSFNELQKEKFGQLEKKQDEMIRNTETKLENIRSAVEEKLEKTLSERLGQSFETVSKHLMEVQKGLGEMQNLATDVGGLKKVLSNVKLRGGVGEVQLAMLLEQILAPNQYDANVCTKKGSSEPVEFAIKLPGRNEDENQFVYLPIDAKFPKDAYEQLIVAYENVIPDEIEAASRNMETTIRKMAKDIRDKYIDPPGTTDFAIMFLPFESIYAEVIRRSALVDQLRDEFKISVAGPTTLLAILNSLQMGFRTLAIQKRSGEVWGVLASVKSEFDKFGGMLEKAQKNIQAGLGQLDDVVGTRTRAIQRQLRNVESLPVAEIKDILPELPLEGIESDS
ncbi:MAG TPA: DNA recombination protein RmuC [Puia sp.]|nr:DNA recombination protein RmuC [Puia sp.]